jgi:hypothetical protein
VERFSAHRRGVVCNCGLDEAKRNPETVSQTAKLIPDFAEPVIGRRFAPTRWLHPSYVLTHFQPSS